MSSAWDQFNNADTDDLLLNINSADDVCVAPVPVVIPKPVVVGESIWKSYLPKYDLNDEEYTKLFQKQKESIVTYLANPRMHPDILEFGEKAAEGRHIDEFNSIPLYQSLKITVDVNMTHRGGGRGIIATEDIYPGELLMCERIRYHFPSSEDLAKEESRVEIKFLESILFTLEEKDARSLLDDLLPLHPRKIEDIDEKHLDYLTGVFGDVIDELASNVPERMTSQNVTKQDLLRSICSIHYNAFPSGMCLHMAMVNHSCIPNTTKLAVPTASHGVVAELRACQMIKKGEEVYICYIPSNVADFTKSFRQAYLHRQFQFQCQCQLCQDEDLHMVNTNTKIVETLSEYFKIPTYTDIFNQDGYFEEEKVDQKNIQVYQNELSSSVIALWECLDVLLRMFENDATLSNIEKQHVCTVSSSAASALLPALDSLNAESRTVLFGIMTKLPWASLFVFEESTRGLFTTTSEQIMSDKYQKLSHPALRKNIQECMKLSHQPDMEVIMDQCLRTLNLLVWILRMKDFLRVHGSAPTPRLADMCEEISSNMQLIFAKPYKFKKVLSHSLVVEHIGPGIRDPALFERELHKAAMKIGTLYNTASVDAVVVEVQY